MNNSDNNMQKQLFVEYGQMVQDPEKALEFIRSILSEYPELALSLLGKYHGKVNEITIHLGRNIVAYNNYDRVTMTLSIADYNEINALVLAGRKVDAIRFLRNCANLGLKDAKDTIEFAGNWY